MSDIVETDGNTELKRQTEVTCNTVFRVGKVVMKVTCCAAAVYCLLNSIGIGKLYTYKM